MHGTDFLVALRNIMPSRTELEACGLDPDQITSVQATFKFIPRKPSGAGSDSARTEIERMILDNDCSTLEIGLIRFLDRPHKHRHGVQVAFCEADPVVVWPGGTVAMHDHANPDDTVICAADSERFLDALSTFLTIRLEKSKWKGRINEAADICAEKAGGNDFTTFFRMLCSSLA